MTFSEAGKEMNPSEIFSTGVDLRPLYKNYMRATRSQDIFGEEHSGEIRDGKYTMFYNLHPSLPANRAMARIVGVNPKSPLKLIWRGDVVVVEMRKWLEPSEPRSGTHMDYVDVQPSLRELLDPFIKRWYNSERWERMLQDEQESCK
jgi:hypothetical protein